MSFTDFKEVTSNNIGSSTRYGGNDLKEIMQIFNNKIVLFRRISIKNDWIFTDHFDLKPPTSTPADPTDTNASRLYADPSTSKVKIKKTNGTVIDVENIDIPNTALQTINDKSKLHTALLYKDQNNDMGAFWHDIAQISTPSNPSAGTRRVFVNSATGELSVRTSAGTTVSLETMPGPVGDVLTTAANTYQDFDQIFRSSRIKIRNPANTFSYSLVGSAITAARNVTLPLLTADDTLVTTAFAQTLTNKTVNVDANTVKHSTTNQAGDILYNNGTSFTRLARGTANQVLTVNAGGTDIAWAAAAGGGGNVSTGQVNTYGDFDQIFRSGRLDVRNPANTFSYSITGSAIAADRAVTLPLLTADDTLVTAAFAQTLANKTIAAGSNTITGLGDAEHASHTTTKITTTNKALLNSAIIYNDQTNTFGDFGQIFRSSRLEIRNPANTFSYLVAGSAIAADRTMTLPLLTGNDIAVTEAFAQTLTNKTIEADVNAISGIAQNPLIKRWGSYQPHGAGTANTTVGTLDGILVAYTPAGAGTPSATWDTTEGLIINLVTGTTSGNIAGLTAPTTIGMFRRATAVKAKVRFKISTVTSSRLYFGFSSLSALLPNDTPLATTDSGIIVGFNTTDTNFTARGNDGSGTPGSYNLGTAKNANFNTIEINWSASGNVNVIFNGLTTTISTAADLPIATTNLFLHLQIHTTTTSSRTISIRGLWIEAS